MVREKSFICMFFFVFGQCVGSCGVIGLITINARGGDRAHELFRDTRHLN